MLGRRRMRGHGAAPRPPPATSRTAPPPQSARGLPARAPRWPATHRQSPRAARTAPLLRSLPRHRYSSTVALQCAGGSAGTPCQGVSKPSSPAPADRDGGGRPPAAARWGMGCCGINHDAARKAGRSGRAAPPARTRPAAAEGPPGPYLTTQTPPQPSTPAAAEVPAAAAAPAAMRAGAGSDAPPRPAAADVSASGSLRPLPRAPAHAGAPRRRPARSRMRPRGAAPRRCTAAPLLPARRPVSPRAAPPNLDPSLPAPTTRTRPPTCAAASAASPSRRRPRRRRRPPRARSPASTWGVSLPSSGRAARAASWSWPAPASACPRASPTSARRVRGGRGAAWTRGAGQPPPYPSLHPAARIRPTHARPLTATPPLLHRHRPVQPAAALPPALPRGRLLDRLLPAGPQALLHPRQGGRAGLGAACGPSGRRAPCCIPQRT
jgi:hypothetical protein